VRHLKKLMAQFLTGSERLVFIVGFLAGGPVIASWPSVVIDPEAAARLALHWVVILPSEKQLVVEPLMDDLPASAFRLVGAMLFDKLPSRALVAARRRIRKSLAIRQATVDLVKDGVDGRGGKLGPWIGRHPRLDHLNGVALGIFVGGVADIHAGQMKPCGVVRANCDVYFGRVEPNVAE
jgi:hypothetical protein